MTAPGRPPGGSTGVQKLGSAAVALITVMATIWSGIACADNSANPSENSLKIGSVNFQQLLMNSAELKNAMSALKIQYESERQDLLKLQFDAKNHPDNAQLQQEFSTKAADFQKRDSSSRDATVHDVSASILESIKQYATSQGFDLIVGGTPFFVPPVTAHGIDSPDITRRVEEFMRHPVTTGPMGERQRESVSLKLGQFPGMNIGVRSGEQVRAIRDVALANDIQIVFENVYFSRPSIDVIDIGAQVKIELDTEAAPGSDLFRR